MAKRRKQTKRANRETQLVSLRLKCGNCEQTSTYKRSEFFFYAHTWEGDHTSGGHALLNLTCKTCGMNLTPEIESW